MPSGTYRGAKVAAERGDPVPLVCNCAHDDCVCPDGRHPPPAALALVVSLDSILLWNGTRTIDLLKMDADGPEVTRMERTDALIAAQKIEITTIVVEGSGVPATTLHRFQKHGRDG